MRRRSPLPGFKLAMAVTLIYLGLMVLLPLSTLFFKTASIGPGEIWRSISSPRALAAFQLSFGASLAAAAFDAVFGVWVAWVLVRYRFPGRALADALIDLPFALPTAVTGIALTTLYAENGWLGQWLAPLGIRVAFTPLGVSFALAFVSFPFVVRSVQPVLEDLDPGLEEVAATLGASRISVIVRIVAPQLAPPLLTGFALAFARALGEYGSVAFISGNMPMRTEIAPLLIMTKLEQFDYAGATAVALVMLLVSFALLLVLNRLQSRSTVGESP